MAKEDTVSDHCTAPAAQRARMLVRLLYGGASADTHHVIITLTQ